MTSATCTAASHAMRCLPNYWLVGAEFCNFAQNDALHAMLEIIVPAQVPAQLYWLAGCYSIYGACLYICLAEIWLRLMMKAAVLILHPINASLLTSKLGPLPGGPGGPGGPGTYA